MLILRTQDKLDHALQQRPKPDELVRSGILTGADFMNAMGTLLTLSFQRTKHPLHDAWI